MEHFCYVKNTIFQVVHKVTIKCKCEMPFTLPPKPESFVSNFQISSPSSSFLQNELLNASFLKLIVSLKMDFILKLLTCMELMIFVSKASPLCKSSSGCNWFSPSFPWTLLTLLSLISASYNSKMFVQSLSPLSLSLSLLI